MKIEHKCGKCGTIRYLYPYYIKDRKTPYCIKCIKGELSPFWKGDKSNYRKDVHRFCKYCNKEFLTRKIDIKNGYGKFCSRHCTMSYTNKYIYLGSSMRGKRHTKETIDKMKKAKRGKRVSPNTEFKKGHQSWNWMGGKNSVRENIKLLPKYKEWRYEIFKRDKFTCQNCGIKSGQGKVVLFSAHHKTPFFILLKQLFKKYNHLSPIEDRNILIELAKNFEPFWDINNGITLCTNCHENTNNFGGKSLTWTGNAQKR